MINVAIVEDEKPAAELIGSYLQEFGRQEEEEFSVRVFGDAVSFLENYKPDFDLVFMDIMMPSIDGMRAAKKLRHYEQLKSNIDLVNVKCHDIKHYIDRAGAGGGIDPEELKDLVNIYDSEMETGNETLDIVLSEYRIYCNSHGILFTAFADGAALRYMNVSDICSLFGNIMENAVEACERVTDTERRVISLNVRSVAGQVSVCAENYFEGEVKFADGLPVTGKEDTFRHGYGVKSIRMIAEKYGGSMQCSARDGLFRVSVLFPVPSERKDRV